MDEILQTILELVREQQRDAVDLKDTMTRAEVVDLTMSMMAQQGVDEYHEDLEQDIYNRIQYLAPRLFEHEQNEPEPEIHMEKFSYRMEPTEEALLNNTNLQLDQFIGNELQVLSSSNPNDFSFDNTDFDPDMLEEQITQALMQQQDTEQFSEASSAQSPSEDGNDADISTLSSSETHSTDTHASSGAGSSMDTSTQLFSEDASSIQSPSATMGQSFSEASSMEQLTETLQDVLSDDMVAQSGIDEQTLNALVLEKYAELQNNAANGTNAIDSDLLFSLVMQSLSADAQSSAMPEGSNEHRQALENRASSANQADASPSFTDESDDVEQLLQEIWGEQPDSTDKTVENHTADSSMESNSPSRLSEDVTFSSHSKSVFKPSATGNLIDFPVQNTSSYLSSFADYLVSFQENELLFTGFSSIDRLLETGLENTLYVLNARDMIDSDAFLLQLADQIAKQGTPVCYVLFHHLRYDCMAKSLSRLTYELRGKEKAISLSSLYSQHSQLDIANFEAELNEYEQGIAPNLYFIESAWTDSSAIVAQIQQLLQMFETKIGQTPVFLLDDLSICAESRELFSRLEQLCSSFDFPLITSSNRTASDTESASYCCLDLSYTSLEEQDCFTKRELLLENGDSLLVDVTFTDGFSKLEKQCQLLYTPKFYCFQSRKSKE